MKTYFLDLIPRLQRFSQKLDDLTMLTNKHWVILDEIANTKIVYIFRENYELLISQNGKVERAKWEYLGNNSLLIDIKEDSYLFRHGFLDKNILALKIDSKNEYAFLVNENKYDGELNSINKIADFLSTEYLNREDEYRTTLLKTNKGNLEIRTRLSNGYTYGDLVFLNGKTAPDGKYVNGWPACMNYIVVKDGKLKNI